MPWFKVDDSFHSHPKAAAASLAAIGLWTVAGAWCGDHLTDGFVPDHMIPLLSRGAAGLADELVSCGLWRRKRAGYQFHQWVERNPQASAVRELRAKRAAAGRAGGLASGKARSKREANASARASPGLEPPTRPDPLLPRREGGSGDARAQRGAARPPDCPRHRGYPANNCGLCRSERLAPEDP